jgi:hypothetical protein
MTVTATFMDMSDDGGTVQFDPWGWSYEGDYGEIDEYFERIDSGVRRPWDVRGEGAQFEITPSMKLTMTMVGLAKYDSLFFFNYEDGFEPRHI